MKKELLLIIICFSFVSCAWFLEDHNNPYDYTVNKPNIDEIIGDYQISETSRKRLNIPKNVAKTILIKLYSNKTFEFINIPENELYKNEQEFKTTNETGTWNIKLNQGSWVLPLTIKSKYDESSCHLANQYHLNKNKPPYQILKMVDIENWDAIIFDKK